MAVTFVWGTYYLMILKGTITDSQCSERWSKTNTTLCFGTFASCFSILMIFFHIVKKYFEKHFFHLVEFCTTLCKLRTRMVKPFTFFWKNILNMLQSQAIIGTKLIFSITKLNLNLWKCPLLYRAIVLIVWYKYWQKIVNDLD